MQGGFFLRKNPLDLRGLILCQFCFCCSLLFDSLAGRQCRGQLFVANWGDTKLISSPILRCFVRGC